MADRMAVTDTHALLYHAAGGRRLGPKAAKLFAACDRREVTIYVPVAVIWETCTLARSMRINLKRSARAFFQELFASPGFQLLPLDAEQALDADDLAFTRDPFDALICAAARDLNLPLVTKDAAIAASGALRVIW